MNTLWHYKGFCENHKITVSILTFSGFFSEWIGLLWSEFDTIDCCPFSVARASLFFSAFRLHPVLRNITIWITKVSHFQKLIYSHMNRTCFDERYNKILIADQFFICSLFLFFFFNLRRNNKCCRIFRSFHRIKPSQVYIRLKIT